MQKHIYGNQEALRREAAALFITKAEAATGKKGRFSVCLSGGSTPAPLYRLLGQAPYRDRIDWKRVHVFWGDERCVPPDHPDSNYRMAREALLTHVSIPPEQIHPVDGRLSPAAAAVRYQQMLEHYFGEAPPAFDFVWLGMGDDGHTASLFPHTSALNERERWVTEVYLPDKDVYRITLTAPLLNQAETVAFIVTGAGKAEALREVLTGHPRPDTYPAQLIRPQDGDLHWFLDEAAAGLLS